MFNKNMITWILVIVGLLVAMVVCKTIFPWIFFSIAMIGWIITGTLIISLTGLQNKIFKAFNQSGLVYSKKIKIPFIGEADISSISGSEIILKFKRK